MKVSTKPTYAELERDLAFTHAAYKQVKNEKEELEAEFLKLDALVTQASQMLGSYVVAKYADIPEVDTEDND